MDAAARGEFGAGWLSGADDEQDEPVHEGAIAGDQLAPGLLAHEVHDLIDAAGSPSHFDPVDMDSHDDFDLNGDGVVNHADVSTAIHGLHDFHAHEHSVEHVDVGHAEHPEHVEIDHGQHADPAHLPDHGFFHH